MDGSCDVSSNVTLWLVSLLFCLVNDKVTYNETCCVENPWNFPWNNRNLCNSWVFVFSYTGSTVFTWAYFYLYCNK